VQEVELSLKPDGVWSVAKAGDLVRMPRGIPHGYFNKSDKRSPPLSPAGKLSNLFKAERTNRRARSPSAFGPSLRRLSAARG
jgi:hypothetical protein